MPRFTKKDETLLESLGGIELPDSNEHLPSKFTDSAVRPAQEMQVAEVDAQIEEVQQAAKLDLNFLAGLAMPTVFTFLFPPVLLSVWSWLITWVEKDRVFPQLALGLPRGFGKSTLMKLFLLFCILYTRKKFILVIAENQNKANNIISDVMDMLEEPNIKAVFGDWEVGCEKNTQDTKKFGFRGRNITIVGLGSEGPVRGLNLKNERPDVMLMDDIQSRECADSEVQSESLERWMIGSLMKAKSPTGCMFLFVGNMYPTKYSILRKLKSNPRWIKFITGGILSDGTSLWEELQPIEQLLNEFENDLSTGRPEIFYSEVLNDENVSANHLIDLSKLPELPYEEGDISGGNFVIIDPANDKRKSDCVAIGYFEVYDAKPVLRQLVSKKLSPGETIREALKFCLNNNCRLIAVESVAYQYSLLYWFNFICEQLGIEGIVCVDIYPGVKQKNTRINSMLRSYAAGELFIDYHVRLEAHLQITQYNPLKYDNADDILDLLTYAPRVMVEYEEYVTAENLIESQEYESIEVPAFNSLF